MQDYYKILEINRNADQNQIKKAFRTLARKYHPDLNPDDKVAEEKFKEVNEAYNTLNDAALKKAYDEKINKGFDSNSYKKEKKESRENKNKYEDIDFENIEKNFEKFFGFNPKSRDSNIKKDIKKNPIDMTEAFENYFMNKTKKDH